MVALFDVLGRPFPPILVVFSYPILPTFENSRKKAIINTINYMEKEYQTPTADVVIIDVDKSILESSVNGSRNNYGYADGWED